MKLAVVLLSGGLDSATTLAMARAEGFSCHTLTFDYGQRHRVELAAAKRLAESLGATEHRVVSLDLVDVGGSALTDTRLEVPTHRSEEAMGSGVPVTYVPARNTLFLAYALGYAEVAGARDIFVGVNAVDYSGYPDCRPEFLAAFEALANLATRAGVEGDRFRVQAPLLMLTKGQIIQRGVALGLDYGMTHSCYAPASDGAACGGCDSCLLRSKGFREAGVADPTRYVFEEPDP